jgi:hypothetical protein
MAERLAVVRRCVSDAIDRAPPGPVRLVSACAGDGRDVLEVLVDHPRRSEVWARLVESDPVLSARARQRAEELRLRQVEVVRGDASLTDAFAGAVPAQVVLVCGIFGNISDADVHSTVRHVPELCAAGATVVWTRGRFVPDLTPTIRRWFAEEGFDELTFETIGGSTKAVGAHRLRARPRAFRSGMRLFTFLPPEERPSNRSARAP